MFFIEENCFLTSDSAFLLFCKFNSAHSSVLFLDDSDSNFALSQAVLVVCAVHDTDGKEWPATKLKLNQQNNRQKSLKLTNVSDLIKIIKNSQTSPSPLPLSALFEVTSQIWWFSAPNFTCLDQWWNSHWCSQLNCSHFDSLEKSRCLINAERMNFLRVLQWSFFFHQNTLNDETYKSLQIWILCATVKTSNRCPKSFDVQSTFRLFFHFNPRIVICVSIRRQNVFIR